MTGVAIHESIQKEIGALFTCTEHGDYTRIRTPYLYPDGDYIDLFYWCNDDTMIVTDLAETMGWLWMQSGASRRSRKQMRLVEDACVTHGVKIDRGMILARPRAGETLGALVTRVAQAALRISDLSFTFRNRADGQSVADRIADRLADRRLRFERQERFKGRSGRSWTVHFCVRARRRRSLVCVLSASNTAMTRRQTEHVLAAWSDLSGLAEKPKAWKFVSLFDDTVDVWAQEDFRMLGELSTVCRWARPEEFMAVLAGKARRLTGRA